MKKVVIWLYQIGYAQKTMNTFKNYGKAYKSVSMNLVYIHDCK